MCGAAAGLLVSHARAQSLLLCLHTLSAPDAMMSGLALAPTSTYQYLAAVDLCQADVCEHGQTLQQASPRFELDRLPSRPSLRVKHFYWSLLLGHVKGIAGEDQHIPAFETTRAGLIAPIVQRG